MTTTRHLLSSEFVRFPLWVPVLLGAGIAWYFGQNSPPSLLPYAVALLLVAIILPWAHKRAALFFLLAAAMALLMGVVTSGIRLHRVAAPVLAEPVFFKPVIGTVEDIQHREKKIRLVLADPEIEGLAASETPKRLSITLKKLDTRLTIGDRIALPAMLFPPPSPAMPGAYDFSRMFYFSQLGAVGFSPRQPEIQGRAQQPRWQEKITNLRLSIADHLQSVMGKDMGAIAAALMVGDQSRVPEAISDSMRESGIYHILSISGLHMTLATGLIFFTLRMLLVLIPHTAIHWPNKKIAAVGGLLGGLAYLLLAGSPVPAVRAYIMVACVLVAVLVDRRGISMVSLAWAATIILVIMPESLFSASFQLTFAATLAIVALYERYGDVLFHAHAGPVGRFGYYFLGLILTSLAATLYTTPLAITHFNRMAIYGILTNMLMVPLSSFWIMPAAMLSFLTMPLGWDAPFLYLLKLGLEWMMLVSDAVAHIPFANFTLPSPSDYGFVAIILGGLWLALWVTRLRWLGIIPVVAGLSTIALVAPYDIIISDDAKRIAWRSGDEWVMLRGDVDSYEAETWLRAQGSETILPRKAASGLKCDKSSCLLEKNGHRILVIIKKERGMNPCESGADIIITDHYADCPDTPHIIDRAHVRAHGATALRLGKTIDIATTEENRGRWPWVKQTLVEPRDGAMMGQ